MAKLQRLSEEGTQSLMESDLELGNNPNGSIGAGFEIDPPVNEVRANVVLKLSDLIRQGRVNLDGEDFVIDPKTGKQRKARLLRGVNTIWQDEQDKLEKDFVNRNKRSLEFENKTCVIQHHDITAIQFAEVCNSNEDNDQNFGVKPIYFKIWNPLKDAEREEAAELKMIEAMQLAATMPAEKMYRHAVYLGVSLADEMGNKAKEKAVRTLYMRKARQLAQKFLDSAENPAVELSWAIKTLLANGQLDVGKQAGQIYWLDGGYVTAIPDGEDVTKYLERFALMDGEKNRNFANQLKMLVK